MAGLAEAGLARELLMCWAGLIVIGAFLIAASIRRSPGMAVLVIGLSLLFAGAFEPWQAFAPIQGEDPDLIYWVGRYRFMGAIWAGAIVVAILLIVLCRMFPKRTK